MLWYIWWSESRSVFVPVPEGLYYNFWLVLLYICIIFITFFFSLLLCPPSVFLCSCFMLQVTAVSVYLPKTTISATRLSLLSFYFRFHSCFLLSQSSRAAFGTAHSNSFRNVSLSRWLLNTLILWFSHVTFFCSQWERSNKDTADIISSVFMSGEQTEGSDV